MFVSNIAGFVGSFAVAVVGIAVVVVVVAVAAVLVVVVVASSFVVVAVAAALVLGQQRHLASIFQNSSSISAWTVHPLT